jgi:hypothetical protein
MERQPTEQDAALLIISLLNYQAAHLGRMAPRRARSRLS